MKEIAIDRSPGARELGEHVIRVTCIVPGGVRTPSSAAGRVTAPRGRVPALSLGA